MADMNPGAIDLFTEIGSTGLKEFSGYVRDEFLKELQGLQGGRKYREMSDNDPIIGSILFAIEQLIRSAEMRIKPASDAAEDVERAELLQSMFVDMVDPWEDTLVEILTMLPFGWQVTEIVYKRRGGPDFLDPKLNSRFDDGLFAWQRLSPRSQDTLLRWELADNGDILGMWQQPWTGGLRFLPSAKIMHFRPRRHKRNPEGRSVLRNAYTSWFFKTRLQPIEAIGVERDLAGLPYLKVPSNIMRKDSGDAEKALYALCKDIVTNIRRDNQDGVILPSDADEHGNLAYSFELLSSGGSRQFDVDKIIQRYDQRIAMTMLADFILLGHEKVGSFALNDGKSDLFSEAVAGWLDAICAPFNRHAIPQIWRLNGWPMDRIAEMEFGDLRDIDVEKFTTALKNLSGAGMPLFPDEELENHIRTEMGLPELNANSPRDIISQTGQDALAGGQDTATGGGGASGGAGQ